MAKPATPSLAFAVTTTVTPNITRTRPIVTETAPIASPDPLDARRRRAVYRCAHRGTKEMDILLGRYADAHIPRFTEAELTRFERFISLPDPELQLWFFAPDLVQGLEFADLVTAVRRFHGLPDLPDVPGPA
ncbi:MAG: succinate dehydrogenase assembly factor 2 [Hyphomicrobiaceae bacterium]|nr:succinate dehydrogenase assembly factor 2 [Hyphomicrobiaceae bacterium]